MELTIGGYLEQVILLKISAAIQLGDADLQGKAKQFKFLIDAHFLSEVSAVAGKRQRVKKLSKTEDLPLQSDMNKLSDYLKQEICKITTESESLRLSKLTLSYLILYNKQRPTEVAEITHPGLC